MYTKNQHKDHLRDMYWGYGGIDFGCDEKSVLDPTQADFLGCKHGGFSVASMDHLSTECAESRLWGGMHFTSSVSAGQELCKDLGSLGFERVQKLRNNSTLGEKHVKNKERPICVDMKAPTAKPSIVSSSKSGILCTKLRKDLFNDCELSEASNETEDFNTQPSSSSKETSNEGLSSLGALSASCTVSFFLTTILFGIFVIQDSF